VSTTNRIFSFMLACAYACLVCLVVINSNASAASMGERKVTLESALPGSTNQNIYHEFLFRVPSATAIGSMKLQYCTTPLGTCTAPAGLDFTANGVSLGTSTTDQAYGATNNPTTAFTNTYAIDITGTAGTNATSANELFIDATATNSVTANDYIKLRFDNIENPTTSSFADGNTNGQPDNVFFVRISTYDDTTYDTGGTNTPIDTGTVAAAIEPILTVSARVQEILQFCVANTSINDNSTNPLATNNTDCSTIVGTTGSTVDLGVADSSTTSAVSPSTGGNNLNGLFVIRTNAVNGSVVGYRAVQQTGTNFQGSLRISGANCGGAANTVGAANSSTDQCFNANTTKTSLTTAVEQFGMTGRFINRVSSATPTANLSLATDYDSTSTVGYAWDQSGSFAQVASSTGSTDKVIDDEAVVLKFAAVAALTTPTGQYQAQADFIAVPTY
jgi:hypothetical protein